MGGALRLVLPLVLAGLCSGLAAAETITSVDGVAISTATVARGIDKPVFLTAPRGDKRRVFIVTQTGKILILADGVVANRPFLDISSRTRASGERGLLGLAFHPDYASNGRFFVDYTDTGGNTQVVAYQVSADPDVADAASASTILTVAQPYPNHNGGWLGFGPDGNLYISMGDGGGAGDPHKNGLDPNELLGKSLRINVDHGAPYVIPASNPFAKGGGAPQVFLIGVRNPWRPSFDGDNLYVADVGENLYEEVSVVTTASAGANLGWSRMEAAHCYRPATDCAPPGVILPVYEYPHSRGCSITGGYVYRGKAIPALAGRYLFGDYCAGMLLSFRYAGGKATDVRNLSSGLGGFGRINSFGVDDNGEIYLLLADGRVVKVVPAS